MKTIIKTYKISTVFSSREIQARNKKEAVNYAKEKGISPEEFGKISKKVQIN